jgi:hypothetical protein
VSKTPTVWPALLVLVTLPMLTAASGAVTTVLVLALLAILGIIIAAVALTMKRRKGLYMKHKHRK